MKKADEHGAVTQGAPEKTASAALFGWLSSLGAESASPSYASPPCYLAEFAEFDVAEPSSGDASHQLDESSPVSSAP